MHSARPLLLLAVAAGCYGTRPGDGTAGGAGAQAGATAGAQGGVGRETGTAGSSGAGGGGTIGSPGGTGGANGTGASSGTSGGGTGGGGGSGAGGSATGGSHPVFVGGPCVATPDNKSLEVLGRSSNGHIYRRAYDGSTWGDWSNVTALDGTMIDARSDIDCSATGTSVHVVATAANPVGALLHAFGSQTTYNPFFRELASSTFAPSPSISGPNDSHYSLGGLIIGTTVPVLFEFGETPSPIERTPITTQVGSLISSPDIARQAFAGSTVTYLVAFDSSSSLSIYYYVITSGGGHWAKPVTIAPPAGTFTFSPTVCTESGGFGVWSVNIVAAAGGQLWYCRTSSITDAFSSWMPIGGTVASAPDCALAGEADGTVHVVVLNAAGNILDINGKGPTWVMTDLGFPR
jgi:hypothetical protein